MTKGSSKGAADEEGARNEEAGGSGFHHQEWTLPGAQNIGRAREECKPCRSKTIEGESEAGRKEW